MAGLSRPILGALYVKGVDSTTFRFQMMPNSIQESKSSNWSQTAIVGRSSPIYFYSGGSSRQYTLNLEFIVTPQSGDRKPTLTDINEYSRQLRALCYPQEGGGGNFALLAPPVVILSLGWFETRCVVQAVNLDFNMPWDAEDNTPHYLKAVITLEEVVLNPWLYKDVVNNVIL
jgi:hypothetical protein